jgi:hypothetical protein
MKKLAALLLMLGGFCCIAKAQVGVQLSPQPKVQFSDDDGNPLAGGKVCTYVSGSNTPQPTYTDYMGTSMNTNPVILDSAGRAQIWYDTTLDYRIVLRTAGTTSTCADGTVLWTVDGVQTSSLTMVGNLPPLFTSSVVGGAVTFTLSTAAAGKVFGNCTAITAVPSYCAIGTDGEITFNNTNKLVGQSNLTWDYNNWRLDIINGTNNAFASLGPGGLSFASGGVSTNPPRISALFSSFDFIAGASQDIQIGQSGNNSHMLLPGNDFGMVKLGQGASRGAVYLNDGNSMSGSFAGAQIIMGFVATPEGVVDAETGSIFLTTAGGSATTLFVKESSPTTNTGWIGK